MHTRLLSNLTTVLAVTREGVPWGRRPNHSQEWSRSEIYGLACESSYKYFHLRAGEHVYKQDNEQDNKQDNEQDNEQDNKQDNEQDNKQDNEQDNK